MKGYSHTTETTLEGATHCAICGKPFLMYWKDKEGKNGQSDTTTKKEGKIIHYFECANGKSLQQLNKERSK